MKRSLVKILSPILCSLVLCVAAVALSGCLFGAEETFELVSAEFVQDEDGDGFVYVRSERDKVYDSVYLKYNIAFKFKSSEGNELSGKTSLRLDDEDNNAVFVSVDGRKDSIPLLFELSGYDDDTLGENKELSIKFKGDGESVSGECDVKAKYDVVHVVTKCELNEENKGLSTLEKEYTRDEQFDPSLIKVNLTYGDETTETVGFDRVMEMKQLKGAMIEGFDSSTCGFGKNLKVTLKSQSGSSTTTLYYHVTPSSEWTRETASGYGQYSFYYYKTADMTVGSEMHKGINTLTVSFGNVKLYAVQGSGILSNPTSSMVQAEMNKAPSGSSVNLFNIFVPSGNTAAVTDLIKLSDSSIKVKYDLKDGTGTVVSKNFMYDVYSTAGKRQIIVTAENIDSASDEEIELIEEFVSYVWFR